MFDNIENLKILNSSSGTTTATVTVTERKTNTFVFRSKGSATYDFGNETVTINEGEMIFLPCGISYSVIPDTSRVCRYTSITFTADLKEPEKCAYSLENCPEADYIIGHFADLWTFGNQADRYKCISLFYSLLSYLSNVDHLKYSDKKKYRIIEPAVRYLNSHIFDPGLKSEKLHLLCGVSSTYFRKIFTSNFGVSPQKYIVNKRITHAKSVFDSGDFNSVSEVANSVGYTDPLYFSRAFKKKYGTSPTKMT